MQLTGMRNRTIAALAQLGPPSHSDFRCFCLCTFPLHEHSYKWKLNLCTLLGCLPSESRISYQRNSWDVGKEGLPQRNCSTFEKRRTRRQGPLVILHSQEIVSATEYRKCILWGFKPNVLGRHWLTMRASCGMLDSQHSTPLAPRMLAASFYPVNGCITEWKIVKQRMLALQFKVWIGVSTFCL